MPAHSTAFKNAVLDGTWASMSWRVRLWQDRPNSVGAQEADFGGYTPPEWDGWDAADGAARSTSGLVDMGTPSGPGTDACRYWSLNDVDTDELAFSAPLEDPINVAESTSPVLIRPTVTHA